MGDPIRFHAPIKNYSVIRVALLIIHPPLSNKKASNKKLDSQISNFNRKSKDLIRKSNENSLLKDKKSRLSLEKSYFLLDRGGCNNDNKACTCAEARGVPPALELKRLRNAVATTLLLAIGIIKGYFADSR